MVVSNSAKLTGICQRRFTFLMREYLHRAVNSRLNSVNDATYMVERLLESYTGILCFDPAGRRIWKQAAEGFRPTRNLSPRQCQGRA